MSDAAPWRVQVLIEELEPADPSAVAEAARQKRKADKEALEPPPKRAVTPAPKAVQKQPAKTPEAKTPKAGAVHRV